ncbi:MAG: hypothetical protein LC808_43595 [Actinobacteria bacterium]|nr:hypothetical protein [Actinomycetota bacterium]
MREQTWTALGSAQADGLACVICARDYLRRPTSRIPVGRSATGSQVFACDGGCADLAYRTTGVLHIPDEALTAAGMAFLSALERATKSGDVQQAYPDDLVNSTILAAAPLIVAAELRHMAEHMPNDAATHQQLRERADQLDPARGAQR